MVFEIATGTAHGSAPVEVAAAARHRGDPSGIGTVAGAQRRHTRL